MRDILLRFFFGNHPLIIAVVKVTQTVFTGETLNSAAAWISQLIIFNIIFTTIGIISFDSLIKD